MFSSFNIDLLQEVFYRNFSMIPCNQAHFQYLIDRELLIIRNIPKSLSSDTVYKYLSHFGIVLDFQMIRESSSRNQCLVLMKNIKDAIDMQNAKIASIGGKFCTG